jgi:hypothetical protein
VCIGQLPHHGHCHHQHCSYQLIFHMTNTMFITPHDSHLSHFKLLPKCFKPPNSSLVFFNISLFLFLSWSLLALQV